MCIAIVKNKGVDFPKKEVLKRCFDKNSDGAGFMYADGQRVYINKGYMTFKAFYKALQKHRKNIDFTYVIHFRISTQGGVNKALCHPYPLTADNDELEALKVTSNIGIAHNGIIELTSSYNERRYNDTQLFIKNYLTLILNDKRIASSNEQLLIERMISNSRLAVLYANGECLNIGTWIYNDDDGCYYSNNGFKEFKATAFNHYPQNSFFNSYYPNDDFYYDELYETYDECITPYGFDFNGITCPVDELDDYSYCDNCVNRYSCKNYINECEVIND